MMSDSFESLLTLKQEQTLAKFDTQFERLARAVKGGRLVFDGNIQWVEGKESKLHKRKSLLEMMNKALTMEEKNISTARCNNILGSNLERRANNCAHSFTGTRTSRECQP